jgi:acetyl esterase/lipase
MRCLGDIDGARPGEGQLGELNKNGQARGNWYILRPAATPRTEVPDEIPPTASSQGERRNHHGERKSRTSHARPVTLEGTTARFIQTLVAAGGPAIYKMSTADARKVLDSLQSQPIEKLPAHTFRQGPVAHEGGDEVVLGCVRAEGGIAQKPTISPLEASLAQLKSLPPALVITDENDVLRDEGEACAQKLIRAGVHVTAGQYLATIHDFVMLNPLANSRATRNAIGLRSQASREN